MIPALNDQDRPFASRLAARVCSFDTNSATDLAFKRARASIIDTIGVTLAGVQERCTQVLLNATDIVGSSGEALVLGTDRRMSLLDAALVNGTASHALDYDDFSGVFGGHQSVPLVAPLMAIAETRKLSGSRLLLAYLVGVETEIKLARAVHYHHYDKGWHPTSTLGTIGAAAAVSHAIQLDETRTAIALAIAASLSCGLKSNFGTMTKPLHVGQCARSGLMAALLAESGFDANLEAFEHHQGFFNVFNGPGLFDADRALADWSTPLEIEQTSIGLKQFPCCGSTHPAIMMMLAIVHDESINPSDVQKIRIMPHGRRLRHTNIPRPQSSLQAKFSVQYCVARALLDKSVRLEHFEDQAHIAPEIVRLLDLTEACSHPDMSDNAEHQWGAEVIITMSDGRQLTRRADDIVGRDGNHPMSDDELWEKFSNCAARTLPREQIAPLFERLETLDSVSDIGQVAQLAAVSQLHRQTDRIQPIVFAPRGTEDAPETIWVP